MNTSELIETLEAVLSQIEGQLASSVGNSSMCALEKTNKVTQSMKHMEGQQQAYRGALKQLRLTGGNEGLIHYIKAEKAKHEKMLQGPLGASGHWQEYLNGSLTALERIEEIMCTA
jgi:hypothetical protein